MGSPQATTVHKVLLFSQLVILITAGIALWIISIISLIRSATTSFVVNDILNNWKTPLLTGVSILPAGSNNCPYQSFPLFNYTFPGTEAGCNCTSISKVGATLYKVNPILSYEACDSHQLLAGCQNISAIPEQPLSRWREGSVICGTRGTASYYSARSKRDSNGNCISGYSLCPGSRTCVQQNTKCPINGFSINKTNPNSTMFTEVYPLTGSNMNLYISRSGSGMAMAETALTQAGVCADGGSGFWTRNDYPLFDNLMSIEGCAEKDPRYLNVDSMGEVDFLQQNNIYPTIFSNPSADYFFSDSYTYSIAYRPYIQWGCDDRYDDFIGVKGSLVNAVFAFQIIVFVTVCVADVYELFIMPYLICKSLCGKSGFMTENKRVVVDVVFKVIMMIMCMIALILSATASGEFTDLNGCTDGYSKTILEKATYDIYVTFQLDIALFVIALVILILQLTIITLSVIIKRGHSKVGVDEENGSGSGAEDVKVHSHNGEDAKDMKGSEFKKPMNESTPAPLEQSTPAPGGVTAGENKEGVTDGGMKIENAPN